jgi:hypothetical protein
LGSFFNGFSQCEVLLENLKGKYEGECDKGKAEGKGKATGEDIYEGDFKKGLPDGIGKYEWKNKSYYVGKMKKGLRDGKGEMHYYTSSGRDSIVDGYWKKDRYAGKYDKPFEVIAKSGRVNKVNCRLAEFGGQDININVSRVTGGIASITDIDVIAGTFYKHNTQTLTKMTYTRMQQVTYPLRVIFNFNSGETAEIIFNEKADYDVEIQLD